MPSTLMNVAAKSATGSDSTARQLLDQFPSMPTNVGETERMFSLLVGGSLFTWSLASRRPSVLGALIGGSLIFRGLSGHCSAYRAAGINTATSNESQGVMGAGEGEKVELAVTINRSAAELYRFWRRFENLPRFMTHLLDVKELGHGKSHWVARGPAGMKAEWDAELITDRPDEAISWKSLPGSDVDTAGSVHFRQAADGRGTEVRVSLKYNPPLGKVGAYMASLMGQDPKCQIREDLVRLKKIMEGS